MNNVPIHYIFFHSLCQRNRFIWKKQGQGYFHTALWQDIEDIDSNKSQLIAPFHFKSELVCHVELKAYLSYLLHF